MLKPEFYVGYLPQAPPDTARLIRRSVMVVVLLIIGLAITVALQQKKFTTSTFEYGVKTTLEGHFFNTPVPHLVVPLGKAGGEELMQNFLLVGFGKAASSQVLAHLEDAAGMPLNGAKIRLTGTLIYGDGKALFQITDDDNPSVIPASPVTIPLTTRWESLGPRQISGNIVDPKCYFGVMKPGEGKPHRSCAIRCIAGGIPPVLRSQTNEYYVLVDENLASINQVILNLVDDPIAVSGEAFVWNDWKFLRVNNKTLQGLRDQKVRKNLIAFQEGITQCQ